MSSSAIVWTIVIIVVVLIVLGLVVAIAKRAAATKRDRRRHDAEDLRTRAVSDETTLRRHEAEAAEQDALARQLRADADRKAAAAEMQEIQADQHGEHASLKRDEQRARMHAADDIDPDVPDRGRHESADNGGSASRVDEVRDGAPKRQDGPGVTSV